MTNNRAFRIANMEEIIAEGTRRHMEVMMSLDVPLEDIENIFPDLIVAQTPDPKTNSFHITNITNRER